MATIVKNVTTEQRTRVCDFCPRTSSSYITSCAGCGKDVCLHCSKCLDIDPFWGGDTGDYAPRVCTGCKQKLAGFEEQATVIREKYESEITTLEHQWSALCKADVACAAEAGAEGEK